MEFPACSACQNRSTDSEDVARLITTIQATSFNPAFQKYVNEERNRLVRASIQRRLSLEEIGSTADGNVVVQLGNAEQLCIFEFQKKLSLALFYRIRSKPLHADQHMFFTFFTFDKGEDFDEQLRSLDSLPTEPWTQIESMWLQFRYKWRSLEHESKGQILRLATFVHGLTAITLFANGTEYVPEEERRLAGQPFSRSA